MGAYADAKMIITVLRTDFFLIISEKLKEAGYTCVEKPEGNFHFDTDAPEYIRMELQNEALDEMKMKYEGKFREHKILQKMLDNAINRSYFTDKQIERAKDEGCHNGDGS